VVCIQNLISPSAMCSGLGLKTLRYKLFIFLIHAPWSSSSFLSQSKSFFPNQFDTSSICHCIEPLYVKFSTRIMSSDNSSCCISLKSNFFLLMRAVLYIIALSIVSILVSTFALTPFVAKIFVSSLAWITSKT